MVQILVVEDEVIVGLALREELQDLGVQVTVTSDAESALQRLSTAVFDAAIVDIALPGMRGDLFAAECRRYFSQMPIVLSTGMHASEIRARFSNDPKLAILEKPHDFNSLRACLEELGVIFPAGQRCFGLQRDSCG